MLMQSARDPVFSAPQNGSVHSEWMQWTRLLHMLWVKREFGTATSIFMPDDYSISLDL